jgi:hypothetical protein
VRFVEKVIWKKKKKKPTHTKVIWKKKQNPKRDYKPFDDLSAALLKDLPSVFTL